MIREMTRVDSDVAVVAGRTLYRTSDFSDQKLTPAESLEQEISRLTWAVVDGWASREERNELAALVELQHEYRHLGS
ncbi:hypothetical protein Pla144_29850 [Bythopirellula polymerisocia]|uniref:Uncharacterized protein n=2 Tax=Bythopirellula polymerisocia TaxID=2528003 RepID=A0A5C6CLK3_9BACT|nr:hypothetical protein Pla144_29850 [Bythopirellula polymerisocia]